MRTSPTWTRYAVGALLLGGIGGPASGQAPAAPAPLVNAAKLRMQPEEQGAEARTFVFSNQANEGFYVYRNRVPPNQTTRPHYHDKDRWVTVIKGTWYTGDGDVYKPETMVPIKEGGFMYHPAGYRHYDGSRDGKEVIVQVMGIGPARTIYLDEEKSAPGR